MGKSAGRGERKQECADKALKIKDRTRSARIRAAAKAPAHRQFGPLPSPADEEIVFDVYEIVKEESADWTRARTPTLGRPIGKVSK
jgi:hypothetical protein